jgi:ubiquinone/menaquinone biosynthesis C-methylase UbiE
MDKPTDIYAPVFVKDLFDRCSASYRFWSHIASFGFIAIWRRHCVDDMPPMTAPAPIGFDLMAGTGEAWPYLLRRRPQIVAITAVDISTEMNRRAVERLHTNRESKIRLLEADVLTTDLPPGCADFVISTFGMKTFNSSQHAAFAKTLARMLKPGGVFSIIEASDPNTWLLRDLYRFYLRRVLPRLEQVFLRGAMDFSMIGIYTREFGNCRALADLLAAEGLEVEFKSYFFGCATGVVGRKPGA